MSRHGLVRHQLFVPRDISERLSALARKPGVTKSSILTEALDAWMAAEGIGELQRKFGTRLDVMSRALARIERNSQIEIEILALLVRYLLASIPPVPENDEVGRAQGRDRFERFTAMVAEAFQRGGGSFGSGAGS